MKSMEPRRQLERARVACLVSLTLAATSALAVSLARADEPPPTTTGAIEAAPSPDPLVVAPPPPAWMTYTNERTVGAGTGAYAGYTDRLEATGRYEMTVQGSLLHLLARYRWRYQGEGCETGREDRSVDVDRPSRRYLGRTDLDEYDSQTDARITALLGEGEVADLSADLRALTTWVWAPPGLAEGAEVQILERTFRVVDRPEIEVAGVRVASVHVRAEGTGTRDDAYGRFDTTFVDEYWFDAATGYFLRSDYQEHDTGTVEGRRGGFTQHERVELTGASYVPGTVSTVGEVAPCSRVSWSSGDDASSEDSSSGLGSVVAIVFALVVGLLLWGAFRGGSRVRIEGQHAKVVPVNALEQLPAVAPADAPRLGPFVRHFVEHALRAGEKVACVELADGRCVGVGISDREASIASIFAKDGDACELLRQSLGVSELFTEHRHEVLPSVKAAAAASGQNALAAYNVYETYELLENAALEAQPYDASVIARMTAADLPAVAALSNEVWGIRGERWAEAALAVGDLGFVAKLDGAIVGYAFVSVCGTDARLYGNTVAVAHRGKGLGRELARARIATAAALGAKRAITEVATWNVGSLEVMKGLGFANVGTMWVESAASARVERKLVRR
ncbi:MAG: GNAT family N-acetyltransferase [Sandaracinus sp.]